ncbi:MAG: redoxin domain-containing protein [Firmicutes bacterium]|nr:redoxin domain-containing protein [Bacillota bacterium]
MPGVAVNQPAPDFALYDLEGMPFRLSDYRGKKHVLLVLNRGFA